MTGKGLPPEFPPGLVRTGLKRRVVVISHLVPKRSRALVRSFGFKHCEKRISPVGRNDTSWLQRDYPPEFTLRLVRTGSKSQVLVHSELVRKRPAIDAGGIYLPRNMNRYHGQDLKIHVLFRF